MSARPIEADTAPEPHSAAERNALKAQRKAARRTAAKDRRRTMLTPEGIALSITLAARSARMGALLLDLVILVATIVGLSIALIYIAQGLFGIGSRGAGGAVFQFLVVIWFVAMFLLRYGYFLFFELGPRGATPGKRALKLRVAARDGGRLSVEMVLARNLLRDIEMFLPLILLASPGENTGAVYLAATAWFCLFMLFPLFNRDRLRAGDLVAGTWVVEAPRQKLQAAMTERMGGAPAYRYTFTEAQLAVYGEYEVKTLERVLRENRAKATEDVYHAIAAKIGRSDGWGDERSFLRDYYMQLRAQLEAGMRMGRRKSDKHAEHEL